MKVIITGSTGMIGRGVLLECLDRSEIEAILVINRHRIDIQHPKLKEVLLSDFFEIATIQSELQGYDACFFCLGVSAVGMQEVDYTRLTNKLTLLFAESILGQNPDIIFCYVTGAGTDSSERGRMMWARVKGKTENQLLAMPFKKSYMFRPGYIQPLRGIRSSTGWYNTIYSLIGFLYPLLKRLPKYVTDTTQMARAMIGVAQNGYEKRVLESVDINKIV